MVSFASQRQCGEYIRGESLLSFLKYLHGCDSYERHKAVADAVLNSDCDSRTILDIGGETRVTTNRLALQLLHCYYIPPVKRYNAESVYIEHT